jgi:hypothetical protein
LASDEHRKNADLLNAYRLFSARAVPFREVVDTQRDLHYPQFRSQFPAGVRPEFHAGRVVGEDENVAFLDAGLAQFRQTGIDQLPADASPTILFGHCQMMQITAPAVMAAEHGANDAAILLRDKTEARSAPQISRYAGRVSDSFNPTPSVRCHNATTASQSSMRKTRTMVPLSPE